jgi:hypothetical protein
MAGIATILALIVLDCSADAVYCRLRENTGGDMDIRQDDGVELVQKKLALFHERTRPLIEHFKHALSKIYFFPLMTGRR